MSSDLRASARSGLLWGVGFTLVRDVLQFLTMIILVRLLSPEIYGQQALAQTIIGFIAVASLKTLWQYPLQARDPDAFDWDTHFSVGAVLNAAIFALTVFIGLVLASIGDLRTIGFVVLVMSPVFLVEIWGTYQLCWLQARHNWKRLRLLLLVGSLIAAGVGVGLAWAGAGVFALAAMPMFLAIPLAADLMLSSEQKPIFSLSLLKRYTDGFRFGLNRAVSSVAYAGRSLAESSALSMFFGFATLGSFNRAIGLAQITSGRIGPVAVQTLYPVLTRAEAATDRFRRFATLLFQGVTWVSAPAAAFLAIESGALVRLLYGHRWDSVIPLLALAGLLGALRSVSATLNQTMLANLQTTACMRVDIAAVVAGLAAIGLAVPFGPSAYLITLAACELVILAAIVVLGARGGAVSPRALLGVAAPCLAATTLAAALAMALPAIDLDATWHVLTLHLGAHAAVFSIVYLAAVWILAPASTSALLDMLPVPSPLRSVMAPLLRPSQKPAGD